MIASFSLSGGSARVTLVASGNDHNRRLSQYCSRSVLSPLLCLVAASFGAACAKQAELPPDGVSDHQLVRLEGPPTLTHATERLRVLVAEFGMGLNADTNSLSDDHIETFCEYAAVYQPDVVVLFDVPFGGPYIAERDVSEELAVCLDTYHRTLLQTHIPRRDGVPLDQISAGPLVLSELPLTGEHWGEVTARPLAPFYLPPTSSQVRLDLFEDAVSLRIGDGIGPQARMPQLQVNRSGTCSSDLVVAGQFPLCVTPPLGWEALRHEATVDFAELGLRALKVEFSLLAGEDSVPVAP